MATPVTTETIMRVQVPCVAAYAMIEAMTHKLANSKHTNPFTSPSSSETRRCLCPLTMINDPSSGLSSTEITKDVPVFALDNCCWMSSGVR